MSDPASQPRPAFPQWLRELDPLLEAEDTNPIYEAFRRRRTVHARARIGTWLRPAQWTTAVFYGAIVLLSILLVVWLMQLIGCCAIPIGFLPGLLVARRLQRHRIAGTHLPRYLSDVYSKGGYVEHAAIDLWMSGLRGRDAVEAIYLETRERRWKWVLAVVAFAAAAYIGTFFLRAGLLRPVAYVHAAAVLYFAWEIAMALMIFGIRTTTLLQVESRLATWNESADFVEAAGTAFVRAMILTGWLIVLLILLYVLLLFAFFVAAVFWAVMPDTYPGEPVHWALSVVLVLAGVVLHLYRERLQERFVPLAKAAMGDAADAFDRFVGGIVLRDPEGSLWAEMPAQARRTEEILHDIGRPWREPEELYPHGHVWAPPEDFVPPGVVEEQEKPPPGN